ncbi:hypothetical protein DERP_008898 [Dermatophagoides pteronyssinus]|uniref:Uncharacterized protein n=1 Tax=Dermatophagoides pteronyssinus TaxID=6956 RepID=A0ABQ8JNL5_DERPT|nr:hypothetical protein DERP_008898 [Dermatophagoides pteronyssinus]
MNCSFDHYKPSYQKYLKIKLGNKINSNNFDSEKEKIADSGIGNVFRHFVADNDDLARIFEQKKNHTYLFNLDSLRSSAIQIVIFLYLIP